MHRETVSARFIYLFVYLFIYLFSVCETQSHGEAKAGLQPTV